MTTREEIIGIYRKTDSIHETSRRTGVSTSTVRRVLVEAGAYTNSSAAKVTELAAQGKSAAEIAVELNLSKKYVQAYMPYTKGAYSIGEKSTNAQRIARHRANKPEPQR